MAIQIDALRSDAMRTRNERSRTVADHECALCCKPVRGDAVYVNVNHETSEFVTDAEAATLGDAVSGFQVGPDCAKRIKKALACA